MDLTADMWLFAAEPGGKLPYTPSEFGYEWWSNGDGSYYAESRDALVTLTLDTQIGGRQVGWVAEDDMGVVERGNFSGMTDLSNLDSICYQGDRLLAQFDTRPAIPPKGFGYDKNYTEDFPNSYPALDFRASVEDAWYHVSPAKLSPGDRLRPGGGPTDHQDWYDENGQSDRQNYVWVEQEPMFLKSWETEGKNYYYRVRPDTEPKPWPTHSIFGEGYTTSGATVVEELSSIF